jgi:hypothetical protein
MESDGEEDSDLERGLEELIKKEYDHDYNKKVDAYKKDGTMNGAIYETYDDYD